MNPWRRVRGPVVVALLVLGTAALMVLAAPRGGGGRLDPDAADPGGGRALARVLADQGVQVTVRTTTRGAVAAAGSGATVLVTDPDLLVPAQVEAVRETGADLVVLSTTAPQDWSPSVGLADLAADEVLAPRCPQPVAQRAGAARVGGVRYQAKPGTAALSCYPVGGGASLLQVAEAGRTLTFVGSAAGFTNRRLDEDGNAALALGLLGQHPRLVWYLPSLSDVPADAADTSFYDLLPAGVWWGATQLGVAALLLALWRARRLGPVVAEPLPVRVPAAETVEGRARLYRRAGARDTAAEHLRAAQRERLRRQVGLPRDTTPDALVVTVAGRTARAQPEVASLLYGAAPQDDHALVRLADELDDLDREVRRS